MSYYKYVKRDEKSRVDWGAITTNLVDTLKEQEAEREKQREAIDASSRATGDILSDAPQGENKAANEWILNASSDASQYLMSQNRLLKSGFLDPRDFTVNRQNVEDSFKALQDVSKNAQQYYKETMDRIENNESIVGMEGAIQEQLNKFQNWSKTQAFVNPTNGKISIGMLDKDGGLSKNASEFSSIEGITNRMRSRYDRYDYSPDLQSWIDGVGKDVRVVRKKGVLTLSDSSQDAGFQTALDEQVGALVDSNPIRVVSILEELGLIDGYDIDGEKTTKKGDKFNVAMKNQNDGIVMPEVTDDMKAKAREFLSGQMLNMLDKEQTAMPKDYSRDAYYRNLGDKNKKLISKLDNVAGLYSGNVEELQSTIQDIMGGNTMVTYAKRTNRGIEIKTADGKGDAFLSFYTEDKDGNEILMSAADFTKSAVKILTGDTEGSYDDILEEGMWSPKRTNFNALDEVEFKRGAEPVDYMAPYRELENKITAEPFTSSDNSAASTLSKILSPLGFTVEPAGGPFNKIIVRDLRGDKESITIPTNESSEDADSQMAKLKAWISEHRTDMEKARFGQQQGGRPKFNG